MQTERSHVRSAQRRNDHHLKEKVDSKEERKEDPATVITFEPHQMMVTMTMVQKTMSRSLNQITQRISEH